MPKSVDQIPDPERTQIWQDSTRYSPNHWSLRLLLIKAIESISYLGWKQCLSEIILIFCKKNIKTKEINI